MGIGEPLSLLIPPPHSVLDNNGFKTGEGYSLTAFLFQESLLALFRRISVLIIDGQIQLRV